MAKQLAYLSATRYVQCLIIVAVIIWQQQLSRWPVVQLSNLICFKSTHFSSFWSTRFVSSQANSTNHVYLHDMHSTSATSETHMLFNLLLPLLTKPRCTSVSGRRSWLPDGFQVSGRLWTRDLQIETPRGWPLDHCQYMCRANQQVDERLWTSLNRACHTLL